MKTFLKTAVLAVALFGSNAAFVQAAHVKGCNSERCDRVAERAYAKSHPFSSAVASWYYDAGATASGNHYRLGVAHKSLRFGTRVRMCHSGNCATVRVQDRGPFIAGREFDLNPGAKAALGCGDICQIRYRVVK